MNFNIRIDGALNMQTDLLIDIFCWQQIILDRMASRDAEQQDCSREDVLEVWQQKKDAIRKDLIESIYAKHGPDLSKDLGL